MRTRENKVYLEAEQRAELVWMTRNGKRGAMEINHANILLDLDENQEAKYTQKQIASKYRMCPETVAKIARFAYPEQLRILISQLDHIKVSSEMVVVLIVNTVLALSIFVFAYRKCGLES